MSALITLKLADITEQCDCDAIINSANKNLRAGSGVCGAIYDAAGPELEPYSIRLAPLALSESVITPGFGLCVPWIIHTRGPKFLFDPEPEAALANAMASIIEMAEKASFSRIAVPAISMGVYAYPPDEAALILVHTTQSYLAKVQSLQEIRFVVREPLVFKAFQSALEQTN